MTMTSPPLLLPVTILAIILTPLESEKHSDESLPSDEIGQSGRQQNVSCLMDNECDGHLGQRCYWLYDGCSTGQCTCDPIRQRRQHSGKCIQVRIGEECCSGPEDVCLEGMICHHQQRKCLCKTGVMTSDRQHCLRKKHKLLDEECLPEVDQCFQKAAGAFGYTKNEVSCSALTGRCECDLGTKSDGISCRNLKINEQGCTKFFHCEGGAVCVDGRCVCPTAYRSAAGGTKCVLNNAVRDLPLGEECDEINERSYCAQGLICHRCPTERHRRLCVKYALSSEASSSSSGFGDSFSHGRLPCPPYFLTFTSVILAMTTTFQHFCCGR